MVAKCYICIIRGDANAIFATHRGLLLTLSSFTYSNNATMEAEESHGIKVLKQYTYSKNYSKDCN